MYLQRTARSTILLRPFSRPSATRIAVANCRNVTDTASTAADGASGKSPQDAQPKILDRNPPPEGEQKREASQHNEEMQQRHDKTSEDPKKEGVNAEKVDKGFWKGTGGEGGM